MTSAPPLNYQLHVWENPAPTMRQDRDISGAVKAPEEARSVREIGQAIIMGKLPSRFLGPVPVQTSYPPVTHVNWRT